MRQKSHAVALSVISFYPEFVSESRQNSLNNLKILKRIQDKKDAASIAHANLRSHQSINLL
jgi:hypothetical protein